MGRCFIRLGRRRLNWTRRQRAADHNGRHHKRNNFFPMCHHVTKRTEIDYLQLSGTQMACRNVKSPFMPD
jgi:hypothetical protein